ncbi:adenosine deaminase [Haliscomenobacter sp.]|uniref:adenosine deaminase n=1 Tax=Haliscomenobacter sp. TaxID=2717303 RepID=UPI0035947702
MLKYTFTWLLLALLILPSITLSSQVSAEKYISDYLNSIRDNRALLTAFFQQMPKGGDLHNHFSGSIYAESYFDYALKADFWVNLRTLALYDKAPTPNEDIKRFSEVKAAGGLDALRYQLLRFWSIKDYFEGDEASDKHFFDAFDKFDLPSKGLLREGLLELKQRAKAENVQYIECMYRSAKHGLDLSDLKGYAAVLDSLQRQRNSVGLARVLDTLYAQFLKKGIEAKVLDYAQNIEKTHRELMLDDSTFTMRFQSFVIRVLEDQLAVFGNSVAAFMSAERSNLIVGVNIVAPEDNANSMRNYWLHMQLFKWCKKQFPTVKFSMHAGELTLGLVKPEELNWHINAAVREAGAHRIGHGVDLAYENKVFDLLKLMQTQQVAVEINLTSNEYILKVKDDRHPISLYRSAKVPIVISTDDAGILRSNLTEQFVLLANRYKNLSYAEIKQYILNSIKFSFIEEEKLKLKLTHNLQQQLAKFEQQLQLSLVKK